MAEKSFFEELWNAPKINIPVESKYVFNYCCFESLNELAAYIWAMDHDYDVRMDTKCIGFEWNGRNWGYFPHFNIDGKLIEVMSPEFYKEDGTGQNIFDHEQDGFFEARRQCAIQNNVEFWDFEKVKPMIEYVEDTYSKDFMPLFKLKIPFPYPKLINNSDYNVMRYFHKSLYEASRKGEESPLNAWENKNLVLQSALNRLQYVGSCRPKDVVQGFNIAKIAPKVSLFKPKLAEQLIKDYLNEYNQIFDPFSGFSGRLIGSANCKKQYIGQDLHPKHVEESNEIIKYRSYKNCTVTQQDILTDTSKSYECLFTCPPYGGKEHWNEDKNEVEKSCDEWIDICLEKYKCKAYLFVVDTTEKYKNFIVQSVENKSHFGKNTEIVILIKNRLKILGK